MRNDQFVIPVEGDGAIRFSVQNSRVIRVSTVGARRGAQRSTTPKETGVRASRISGRARRSWRGAAGREAHANPPAEAARRTPRSRELHNPKSWGPASWSATFEWGNAPATGLLIEEASSGSRRTYPYIKRVAAFSGERERGFLASKSRLSHPMV